MKVDSVEIVPSPAAAKGGQAIIRLKGIWLLPPGATFRIEPADGNTSFNRMRGWPRGDLRPRATRVTGQGVELVIGPDIVDAPDLTPGTSVRLRIPTISLDTVLEWPSLPVARPSHPRALAAAAYRSDDEKAVKAPTNQASIQPTHSISVPSSNAVPMRTTDTPSNAARVNSPSALGLSKKDQAVLQRATPAAAKSKEQTAPAEPKANRQQEQPTPALASLKPRTSEPPTPSAMPDPLLDSHPQAQQRPALKKNGAANPPTVPPLVAPAMPRPTGNARRSDSQNTPGEVPAKAQPPDLPLVATPPQIPRTPKMLRTANEPSQGSKSQSVSVALFSLLIGAIAAIGFRNTPQVNDPAAENPAGQPATLAAIQHQASPPAPASTRGTTTPRAPITPDLKALAGAFNAGATSPRGISAANVTAPDALVAANQSLYGTDGVPADREEAAFWLRTALARQMQGPGITWALTQLGTYYASPAVGQTPDYGKARFLWELAAAQSDPVANCFLAQLHEFGLGVETNRDRARTHYRNAKSLGGTTEIGCKGLDQALARLAN